MARNLAVWLLPLALCLGAAAALPGSAVAEQCDGKATPCPLQKWMRANVGVPMSSGDMPALAKAMEQARPFGGPGMKDWDRMSKKTADDAAANKTEDVKNDCKACHDAYKDAYKKDPALRGKPIP